MEVEVGAGVRASGDWNRFKNRRQVASYTGLVPCEDSSGERRFRGAITKHGAIRACATS